jgi:uncharacterized lipoprotein
MENIIMRKILTVASALSLGLTMAGCSVDKTEDGEAPSMDVDADAGELPEYDVDTPDVNVGTETQTVDVPDVDVNTTEETVEVPTVDVEPAN